MKHLLYFTAIASMLIFNSCEKDPKAKESTPPSNLHGLFAINEGPFGSGNGTISFFSSDSAYQTSDLFAAVNGYPAGNVIQSMTITTNRAYIVVNNSQKIQIVSMNDFKTIASLAGFASPRYFLGVTNGIGYVSDWTDNNVKVVDLNNIGIIKTIPCGNGPDQMILAGGKIFVCNVGGFGEDSTVTVIDPNSGTVSATLKVGRNPNSIRSDINGNLWILCGGSLGPDYQPSTGDDVAGSIYVINPSSLAFVKQVNFPQDGHPLKLQRNNDGTTFYFLGGNKGYQGPVYKMSYNDTIVPALPFIFHEFYGLGVRPSDNAIYGGTPSFAGNGYMLHYNSSGTLLDSSMTGIGTNSFVFN